MNSTSRLLRIRMVDNLSLTANFVTNTAPVLITQPRSRAASAYNSVTFSVRARLHPPFTYQWQRGDTDIPDATNATFVLNFLGHEDSGLYSVRVANAHGTTQSRPARLVVDGY